MRLFSQPTCPLEDSYLKVYGIPAPQKWKSQDCPRCEYQENQKCQYKKVLAQHEQFHKRGQPVLLKRVNMTNPLIQRKRAETDALKKAGLSSNEQKEYWIISAQFDAAWETAAPAVRKDILEHLDQWKVYLEKGLNPSEAYTQVQAWIKQREEFKKQS
jgi:hypothetical protein